MKPYLCAALMAALGGSGVAVAGHIPGHRESRGAGDPSLAPSPDREVIVQERLVTEDTDEPTMTQRIVRYPGRVGTTIVRSPRIVGETIRGDRTIVSKRGFFQDKEDQAERTSMPRGRGQQPGSKR